MERKTKDPIERKNEIIEVALMLFSKKGYENTPISEIVKTVGVAQGTFYYYFKSKEDILNAIAEKLMEQIINKIKQITDTKTLNPIQKLIAIVNDFALLTSGKDPLIYYFHNPSNTSVHQKLEILTLNSITPYISKIIQDGNELGMFNCLYPSETVFILLSGISQLFDNALMHAGHTFEFNSLFPIIEYSLEKMLGAKEGTFKMYFEEAILHAKSKNEQ